MAAIADAYKVETELKKIIKTIQELGKTVVRLESRVAALEKSQTRNSKAG